jgi:hypothetical protein
VIAGLAATGPVRAEDAWVPDGVYPAQPAPAAAARVSGDVGFGYVPVFRSGERDRVAGGIDGAVRLAPVELRVHWDWLADRSEAAGWVNGPGDVRLGTVVTVFDRSGFDTTLGWEVKLPDAADGSGLGTDETDALFGATGGWTGGPWSARLGVGLGILGNPLRFANQDDVPLVRARLGWSRGLVGVHGALDLDLPTSRNPSRCDGDLGLRVGKTWFGYVHGGGGFTPAAADWHLGLSFGLSAPLPAARKGA